jgi:hypothetical protein
MFENRNTPLLSRAAFLRRLGRFTAVALVLILVSWLIGIVGYHTLEGLSWIDSMLNAAMLLGGMGPVDPIHTTGGKIFASFYALFSGIVFLVAVAVLVAPLIHRVVHYFHIDVEEKHDKAEGDDSDP